MQQFIIQQYNLSSNVLLKNNFTYLNIDCSNSTQDQNNNIISHIIEYTKPFDVILKTYNDKNITNEILFITRYFNDTNTMVEENKQVINNEVSNIKILEKYSRVQLIIYLSKKFNKNINFEIENYKFESSICMFNKYFIYHKKINDSSITLKELYALYNLFDNKTGIDELINNYSDDSFKTNVYNFFLTETPNCSVLFGNCKKYLNAIIKNSKENIVKYSKDEPFKCRKTGKQIILHKKGDPIEKHLLGRYFGWIWCYLGRAIIYCYYLSQNDDYLDYFIECYDYFVSLRNDTLKIIDKQKNKLIKSWGVEEQGIETTEVTVCGLMGLPVCEFIIATTNNEKYSRKRQIYLKDLSACVEDFFDEIKYCEGSIYFKYPFDHRTEAFNHVHLYGAVLCYLYYFTKNEIYYKTANGIAQYFKRNIIVSKNNRVSWAYFQQYEDLITNKINNKPEAYWKGSVTLELVIAAQRTGIIFSKRELNDFCNVLVDNILISNNLNIYIQNDNTIPDTHWNMHHPIQECLTPGHYKDLTSIIPFIFGYIFLNNVDNTIANKLISHIKTVPDIEHVISTIWAGTGCRYSWLSLCYYANIKKGKNFNLNNNNVLVSSTFSSDNIIDKTFENYTYDEAELLRGNKNLHIINGYADKFSSEQGELVKFYIAKNKLRDPELKQSSIQYIVIRNAVNNEIMKKIIPENEITLSFENPSMFINNSYNTTSLCINTVDIPCGFYELLIRDTNNMISKNIYFNIKPPYQYRHFYNNIFVFHNFTYHAYNVIGGGSFYTNITPDPKVASINRPVYRRDYNGYTSSIALLKLLHKNNIKYYCIDNIDLHVEELSQSIKLKTDIIGTYKNIYGLGNTKSYDLQPNPILIFGAHDEYWTDNMRINVNNFLNNRGNILVIGGNTCCRRILFTKKNNNLEREIDNYKQILSSKPSEVFNFSINNKLDTIVCLRQDGQDYWENEPNNLQTKDILGLWWSDGGYPLDRINQAKLADNNFNMTEDEINNTLGIKIINHKHPIFNNTNIQNNEIIGLDIKLLDCEADGITIEKCPSNTRILGTAFLSKSNKGIHETGVLCESKLNNGYVINFGTFGWYKCVDRNPVCEMIIINSIDYLHNVISVPI